MKEGEAAVRSSKTESSCTISARGTGAGGGVCWIGVFLCWIVEMRRLHDAILWCLSLASGHDVGYSSENCARLGSWDRPPICS